MKGRRNIMLIFFLERKWLGFSGFSSELDRVHVSGGWRVLMPLDGKGAAESLA